MSETKHTPLPWRWEFLPEDHGYETLIGNGGFRVLMHSEEDGSVKKEDKELIVTSVNACPKVEELVGAAVEALTFVKGMQNDAREDHYFKLAENAGASASRLEEAIRALESALGGKAE